MFITLTIDTHKANKGQIKLRKRKIDASKGWRKPMFMQKRSIWQKIKDWRKNPDGKYKLDGQVAMF